MLNGITEKIDRNIPLGRDELMFLYDREDLDLLAALAGKMRERHNGRTVYYNRNFHLEPSNVCSHRCRFCSYRRDSDTDEGAWTMSIEEVEKYLKDKYEPDMTEVHIVGSVNPSRDFDYYMEIIRTARRILPSRVTIKGYSAIEIADMCKGAGISYEQGLKKLMDAGLEAIPGGGAEIFDPKIRKLICPDKPDAAVWMEVHRTAHRLGLHTNATMLFGHIESRKHRVEHLLALRELQDETGGFDAFIPLKYRIANNALGIPADISGGIREKETETLPFVEREADITEVLRTFAISRLALHNIPHIKSYWPMLGKDLCQLSLLFGADDIDGTINDSTRIYSMAGAEEQHPGLSARELVFMAEKAGFTAVERDSYYREA